MASSTPSLSCCEEDFETFAGGKAQLATKMKRKSATTLQSEKVKKSLQAGDNKNKGANEIEMLSVTQTKTTRDFLLKTNGDTNEAKPKSIRTEGTNSAEASTLQTDTINIIYPEHHKGPFFVLVDTSESDLFTNRRVKSGMNLYQHIRHLSIAGIDTIDAIGVTLYKIKFLNPRAANNFAQNEELKKMKIRPFIPRTAIETYGVIRGVATYLSDKEIIEKIKSDVTVNSVHRFQRRDGDNPEKLIPTTTVKIGFVGKNIPKEIKLEYSKFEVNFYYPPIRQCKNCGRIGHTQKGCRSSKRCLQCGRTEGCEAPCNGNKCILCDSSDHKSSDKFKCPVWIKEKEINEIKTVKKMSRKEVLQVYYPLKGNRFELLDNEETNFPALLPKDNSQNVIRGDSLVNRKLTSKKFSQIVKDGNPKSTPETEKRFQGARPKQKNTPVFERKDHFTTSPIEKLMSEMLKLIKQMCAESKNMKFISQANTLEQLKNKVLIDSDLEQIRGQPAQILNDDEYPTI